MISLRSLLKNSSAWFKDVSRRLPLALCDRRANRDCPDDGRFLVVRHSGKKPHFHRDYLQWLAREFPRIRARFELRLLPCRVRDFSPYALHIPWLQDPVQQWSPWAYRRAESLAEACEAHGVPVVNRASRIANSIKSVCTELIRSAGIRTPRVMRIDRPAEFYHGAGGLIPPFFIREDRCHGGPNFFVSKWQDILRIPFQRFSHPAAVEFIDVRDPQDGLYRKYRYVATGDWGLPRHLAISDHWEVRPENRLFNDATREEEIAFVSRTDPNHERLQAARRTLELDVCAFDYSYAPTGELVVWEANPFPQIGYSPNPKLSYLHPFVEQTFAMLTRFYLHAADLPVPSQLLELCGQVEPNRKAAA